MQGIIHYNPGLSHQVDHAAAFKACGFAATPKSTGAADIHVVSGPYFAKQNWLHHPRVLEIDRAWWGDPDCISIGWLQADGSRKFATGDTSRDKPDLCEWKQCQWPTFGEMRCLVLADYGQDVSGIVAKASKRFNTVNVRQHPADHKSIINLKEDIGWHDVVIGSSGSAMFEAIQMGIPTICLDPDNDCAPVCSDSIDADLFRGDRELWLHEMSYKQFSLAEIADGTAWRLLKDIQ